MVHPFSGSSPQPAPRDTVTVGVSGPAGLLSTLPVLLGFHPTESLVMVCLCGDPDRVGPIGRVDAPTTPAAVARTVAALADAAARHADRLIIAVYTDTPGAVDTAALAAGFGRVRPVVDVIVTGNAPQPTHPDLMAAHAVIGRAVLTDRAELARSVEHDPRVVHPLGLLAEFDNAARRDALVARLLPNPDAVASLVTLAQATPDTDPRVPDVCAALAILAYRHGDGSLARVAIGRSHRTDPDHFLTELIEQFIDRCVPPSALDHVMDF